MSDNVAKPLAASEMSVKGRSEAEEGPFEISATKPQTISKLSRNAVTSFDLFIASDGTDAPAHRARAHVVIRKSVRCPSLPPFLHPRPTVRPTTAAATARR